MTYLDVVKSKAFGVVTENKCKLELDLFAVGEFAKLPENTNIFFELFIKDATGSGQLVDVPVLITNFRDQEGREPNKEYNFETSRMVRRFFLAETISGISSSDGFKN